MSERTNSEGSASHPEQTWRVCRRDDNGNRYIIEFGLNAAAARSRLNLYAKHNHKQLYWIEVESEQIERGPLGNQA